MRHLFYTSVIVFFMLMPGSGISAGLKSTANQSLQHHRLMTLADCVAEVAPETDLLSFQKKYRHKAEQKCREMLAEKQRKIAVITPADEEEAAHADEDRTTADTEEKAEKPETPPSPGPKNYWRNEAFN